MTTTADNCFYKGTSPCANCPYRKDAPLRLWAIEEYRTLLEQDKEQFGKLYSCHKKNGTVCKGWLINQDIRNHPNLMLRISFIKNKITRKYLDKLKSVKPMFNTVEDMCFANYPELKIELEKKSYE